MSKYTLPPREWYTLEKACIRLEELTGKRVDIDDLLHYWDQGWLVIRGAVDIYKIDGEKPIYKPRLGNKSLDKLYLSFSFVCKTNKVYHFSFNDDEAWGEIEGKIRKFHYSDRFFTANYNADSIMLSGYIPILSPNFESQDDFLNFNYWGLESIITSFDNLTLPSSCEFCLDNIDYIKINIDDDNGQVINKSELLVFEDDLIDFLSKNVRMLKAGGVVPFSNRNRNKVKIDAERNNQKKNDVIATLFKLGWGLNSPNEIRNAVDGLGKNKYHPFRKLLDESGIDFPTGKTFLNWLKDY